MVAANVKIRVDGIWTVRVFLFLNAILMVPCLRADDLPLELSLISKDHIGFVQIRLADLWKSESFAPVRMLIAKASPEMRAVFDQRFIPAPSSVERLTLILAANAQGPGAPPEPILVVTTSQAFDRAKLIKGLLPRGVESKSGNWIRFVDEDRRTTVCVLDQRTFAIGPTAAVDKLAVKPRGQAGKLQRAVTIAAGGPSLVAAVKPESFLPALQEMPLPPQLLTLAEAQTIVVSARLGSDARVDWRAEFADPQHAMAGEQAIRFAIDLARQQLQTARAEMETLVKGQDASQAGSADDLPKAAAGLLGLGIIELLDEQLAKLPLERKGVALTLSLELPKGPYGAMLAWGGFSAGLFMPAVQKMRESGTRMTSQNNLKQMALAMHNYESEKGHFPAAAICDKAGKPLLSWRVAMLPYIDQMDLYQKFHLDEPWDSKHNITLLKQMPAVYALPGVSKPGDTRTHYRVFVGAQAMFEMDKGRRVAEVTDGMSNTWLVVEAAEAVPWTKPEELVYNPDKPVPKLGNFSNGGFNVVYADGLVHFMREGLREEIIRGMITHAGGEIIPNP